MFFGFFWILVTVSAFGKARPGDPLPGRLRPSAWQAESPKNIGFLDLLNVFWIFLDFYGFFGFP